MSRPISRAASAWSRPARWANQNFDRSLNWRDIDWVRKLWPGKLVLKGILDVEDAKHRRRRRRRRHRGVQPRRPAARRRALDHQRRCPTSPSAVGDRIEVLFDGGIRSGQDVLKALARGAHGCLIGRAYLYGLGGDGRSRRSPARSTSSAPSSKSSMALTGVRDVQRDVTRDVIA